MTTSSKRKREFRTQLDDLPKISVEGHPDKRISAWEIQTSTGKKVIWLHYNRYFHMWSGTHAAAQKAAAGTTLIHAFLGPKSDQYYIVPDSDLHNEFTLYDQDDGRGWLLNAAGEAAATKENEDLLTEYRSFSILTT